MNAVIVIEAAEAWETEAEIVWGAGDLAEVEVTVAGAVVQEVVEDTVAAVDTVVVEETPSLELPRDRRI